MTTTVSNDNERDLRIERWEADPTGDEATLAEVRTLPANWDAFTQFNLTENTFLVVTRAQA